MSSATSINMLSSKRLSWSLVKFALPIIGSGVVQQSFNSVDIAVVGKLVGSHALAAVGANGAVISLIVTLFMGIALGTNVVIARAIGANNPDVVRRSVSTQAVVSVAGGVFLAILGLFIAEPILKLLDTPSEILADATLYLQLYALGFPAMMVYNFTSAVLRSVGDTLRPFIWLIIGGVVNILLNLILVMFFSMGVEGVAIATTVSGYVSAAGVLFILLRTEGNLHLDLKSMHIYRTELWAMVRIGLPAGVQGTLFALSNVVIQSSINLFGPEVMAGNAAALVYELYGYFIISAFVQAAVAFVSINYGAGQYDMCRKVAWRCMIIGAAGTALLNSLVVWQGQLAIGILTDNALALEYGIVRLRTVLIWQFIATSYEVAGGALRGLGYSIVPMVITLLGTCVVRIIYVKCTSGGDSIESLLRIYSVTWMLTGIGMLVAYMVITKKLFGKPVIKQVT